jgi:hypothetical protein
LNFEMKRTRRKKHITKKPVELLKIGFLVLLLSIIFLSTKLSFGSTNSRRGLIPEKTSSENFQQETDGENASGWIPYTNDEYLISFSHPNLLLKKEFTESGGYDLFVVFEENKFSKEKGVAFGIRKSGLEEEVERIVGEVILQENSKLTKDEEMEVAGERARVLVIEPQDIFLEIRSILIIEKSGYSYSFSTVPEQMQKLIDSIEFLN